MSIMHIIHTSYIFVGTLRQGYPLLQNKDEGAQERRPRTTGPDPADRSRTSAGRTWALQMEAGPPAGLSLRSQPRGPDPAPYSGRGPAPPRVPQGRPPDLRSPLGQGSGAATSPCGRGRRPLGPVPPRVPQARVFRLKPALLPH